MIHAAKGKLINYYLFLSQENHPQIVRVCVIVFLCSDCVVRTLRRFDAMLVVDELLIESMRVEDMSWWSRGKALAAIVRDPGSIPG